MPGIFTPTETGAIATPHPDDTTRAAIEWQAHLDAGRLTAATGPGTTPEIAANRANTEALLRAHAAATRAAQKEGY